MHDISDTYSLRSIIQEPGYTGGTIAEDILVENDNILWGTFDLEPGLYVAVASKSFSGGACSYSVSDIYVIE